MWQNNEGHRTLKERWGESWRYWFVKSRGQSVCAKKHPLQTNACWLGRKVLQFHSFIMDALNEPYF